MSTPRWALMLTTLAAIVMTGCTLTEPTTAEPGDGPATEQAAPKTSEAPAADSKEPTGSFTDKIVYPDGVEVEFTKITHGKVTSEEAQWDDAVKKGDPYVIMALRVRNGSEEKLDIFTAVTVTYGPDGDEAEVFTGSEFDLPQGALLAGKAKTGQAAFLVPAKYQDDVVAEVMVDFEHAKAIFTGTLN